MLTPVDLETMVFRRGIRGYRTQEVQNFMRRITVDYEKLYKENFELKEKIEQYEDRLKNYNEMEETLKNTLCMAQAAKDVKLSAEKQAEVILRGAEPDGRNEAQVRKKSRQNCKIWPNSSRVDIPYSIQAFLQTLIEMADRSLDLDDIWER